MLRWTERSPLFDAAAAEIATTRPPPDGLLQPFVDSLAGEVIAGQREEASFAYAADGATSCRALRPTMLSLYRRVLPAEGAVSSGNFRAERGTGAIDEREGAGPAPGTLGLVRRVESGVEPRLQPRNPMFAAVFGHLAARAKAQSPARCRREVATEPAPSRVPAVRQTAARGAESWAGDRSDLSRRERSSVRRGRARGGCSVGASPCCQWWRCCCRRRSWGAAAWPFAACVARQARSGSAADPHQIALPQAEAARKGPTTRERCRTRSIRAAARRYASQRYAGHQRGHRAKPPASAGRRLPTYAPSRPKRSRFWLREATTATRARSWPAVAPTMRCRALGAT